MANPLSMKAWKTLGLVIVAIAISSAIIVNAVVTTKFPVTIQVSVKEPLVLIGPTPANGTMLASSTKNFTISIKNFASPVSAILYYVTNGTGWNCACVDGGGTLRNYLPFTMTIGGQTIAPAQDGGGGSYCGSPVGDPRCSLGLSVPSGQSTVIATLTAGSNAPIVNFTINFYLTR